MHVDSARGLCVSEGSDAELSGEFKTFENAFKALGWAKEAMLERGVVSAAIGCALRVASRRTRAKRGWGGERGGKPRKLGVRGKHTPPKFGPYISSVLGLKLSLKLRRRDGIGRLIVNTGCRVLRMLRRSNEVSMTSPKEGSGRRAGHDVIFWRHCCDVPKYLERTGRFQNITWYHVCAVRRPKWRDRTTHRLRELCNP